MKKRLFLFFPAMVFLGGMLSAFSGGSLTVRADPESQQTYAITIQVLAHPPARMCVDEKATVQVGITGQTENRIVLTASSSAGTLSKTSWTWDFGPQGGILVAGMAHTVFTATEAGNASIIFQVTEGGSGQLNIGFTIIDCRYEIQLSATETIFKSDVSYQITIEGSGLIDAYDIISGEGSYSFSLLVHYKTEGTGLTCTSEIPSTGTSSFQIQGSRTDSGLNISLSFKPVVLGGGKVKCVDANGRESDMPSAFGGKVTIDQTLPLKNINIAPFQGYKFTFPTKGRGFLTLIPRRK